MKTIYLSKAQWPLERLLKLGRKIGSKSLLKQVSEQNY